MPPRAVANGEDGRSWKQPVVQHHPQRIGRWPAGTRGPLRRFTDEITFLGALRLFGPRPSRRVHAMLAGPFEARPYDTTTSRNCANSCSPPTCSLHVYVTESLLPSVHSRSDHLFLKKLLIPFQQPSPQR